MKKYYHGTTPELAKRILNNDEKSECLWNVSYDDNLYLWSPDDMLLHDEVETIEDGTQRAIQCAFESAQIAAALSTEPQHKTVVLCFEFPDDMIVPDTSCDNMSYAFTVDMSYIEDIKKYYIKAYSTKHNPRLDIFLISGVVNNEYINTALIDDDMVEACKQLQETCIDSLFEFEWCIDLTIV